MTTMMRAAACLGLLVWALGCQTRSESPAADAEAAKPAPTTAQPIAPDAVATGLVSRPIYPFAVRSVAYSPDGKLLAIGSGDGKIRLYDPAEDKVVRTIQAHDNWTFDLAFAPDGTLLSGGGDDRVVRIDPATGEVLATFDDHENDLHGVAVTSDGKWLVTGSDDTHVLLRSLPNDTGRDLGRHDKQVTSVAVSPDNKLVASSSRDGTVRLWDLEANRLLRRLTGHTADVMSVAFSPDGSQLATASYDHTICTWDTATGKPRQTFDTREGWQFTVLYSRDGKYLFAGGADGHLRVYQLEAENKLILKEPLASDVADLAVSPDGKRLAVALSDGWVRFFAIDGPKPELLPASDALIPPILTVPPAQQLGTTEYLDAHQSLAAQADGWPAVAGGLNDAGDAFTLFLLARMDEDQLAPDAAEMRTRMLAHITARRGPTSMEIHRDELGTMLWRATVAERSNHPLNPVLAAWLAERLRAEAGQLAIRDQLEVLREDPPVPAGEDAASRQAAVSYMRAIIDRALADEKEP